MSKFDFLNLSQNTSRDAAHTRDIHGEKVFESNSHNLNFEVMRTLQKILNRATADDDK
jgi:hypothetical protein